MMSTMKTVLRVIHRALAARPKPRTITVDLRPPELRHNGLTLPSEGWSYWAGCTFVGRTDTRQERELALDQSGRGRTTTFPQGTTIEEMQTFIRQAHYALLSP